MTRKSAMDNFVMLARPTTANEPGPILPHNREIFSVIPDRVGGLQVVGDRTFPNNQASFSAIPAKEKELAIWTRNGGDAEKKTSQVDSESSALLRFFSH